MVCGGTNSVAGSANVVGGGTNTVSSDSAQNVVVGQSNSITTASSANMIDGFNNTVTNFQSSLVVGRSNSASGINNIIGGQGNKNTQTTGSALDNLITGLNNTISDTSYSFIGGQGCTINSNANYSFVWGFNASVPSGAKSSVVFSDGTAATSTSGANQFVARASGGTTFYSSSNNTAGAFLAPGSSTWGTPSDVRLKENIRDLGYGLNAVLAMKPLVYNYKGNSASQKAVGFIAQDMLAVVPEVVNLPKDPAEMMGIRYSELVPVLAKAIQDLKQEKDREIQDLRNENAELKAENHRLSTVIAKMDNLEKAVNALQIKVSTQPIAYDK